MVPNTGLTPSDTDPPQCQQINRSFLCLNSKDLQERVEGLEKLVQDLQAHFFVFEVACALVVVVVVVGDVVIGFSG